MTDRRDIIRAAWEEQPESFPDFLKENPGLFPQINTAQKRENKALMQEFSQKMKKKLRQKPDGKEQQAQWELNLESDFMDFIQREKIIALSEWMRPEVIDEFKREAKHFVNRVREFDGDLSPAQIWQSMRNYFIYAVIVEVQGENQNARDPILAYSLLYPYTDNYIDDEQIAKSEKERYNQMIALKLKGQTVEPQNLLEEKTCRLLQMILEAYEGAKKQRIAETLLQLLEAQNLSIGQQQAEVTEEQILEISIWKGSTSVLADYLFAAADWTEYEETFYLKFGFLLQLVDDLQDIEEDRKAERNTLMTVARNRKRLEQRVNRLLWFTWNVIREFEPRNPELKRFVLKSCVEISLLTAARSPQFFSKRYLKALEPYLPLSLDFIKKRA